MNQNTHRHKCCQCKRWYDCEHTDDRLCELSKGNHICPKCWVKICAIVPDLSTKANVEGQKGKGKSKRK